MSNALPPDNVLARIRKLLALANDGRGNENEMAVAAQMAQDLMSEYNLEVANLQSGATAPDADPARGERQPKQTDWTARRDWQVRLMRTLARNYFCKHWVGEIRAARRPGGIVRIRRRHYLIGRAANVEMALSVYEYLINAMERIYPEADYGDRKSQSAQSWFTGCTVRLSDRLTERRMEAERQSAQRGDGKSLVLLSNLYQTEEDLNNDARYNLKPGTTAARRVEYMETLRRAQAAAATRPPAPPTKVRAETPAERAKREKAAAREAARWEREAAKRRARIDYDAYDRGNADGARIALEPQLKGRK